MSSFATGAEPTTDDGLRTDDQMPLATEDWRTGPWHELGVVRGRALMLETAESGILAFPANRRVRHNAQARSESEKENQQQVEEVERNSVFPEKLYFRIGRSRSRLCRLPAYVLRFWKPSSAAQARQEQHRPTHVSPARRRECRAYQAITVRRGLHHRGRAPAICAMKAKGDKKQVALPFTGKARPPTSARFGKACGKF